MNNRQKKNYNKINEFLKQFSAKIKDGEFYEHSELPITIINQYGIERILRPDNIKKLSRKNDYWTFDGVMCDRQKNALKNLKNIAKSKGGEILSKTYIDCEKKLECIDKDGNIFEKAGIDIKKGSWSPFESKHVYNNPEYHLNEIRKIAESKGGKLISTEYINNRNKLELEDRNGQKFLMSSCDLKKNNWSPYESKKVRNPQYHLDELKKIAESKGGKLISTEYIKAHSKLEFEDKLGNRFFITPTDVKYGKWSGYECGRVYDSVYHLNELKKIAKNRGGKLISTKYINSTTKMSFQDINGNIFKATPNSVKGGRWSPFEKVNLSEEITRQCFEFIFEEEFPNVWGVIQKKSGRSLQLDGYNKSLKIAFEYQGEQHYYIRACRGKNLEEKSKIYSKIKNNDLEKIKLCKEKEIFLIQIKYFNNRNNKMSDKDYLEHVIKELENLNNEIVQNELLKIKTKQHTFSIDYSKLPNGDDYLERLRKVAFEKGGRLLSTKYINSLTKLEFEDKSGNKFWKKPAEVLHMNRWSPYEGQTPKIPNYYFQEAKKIIEKNKGKLISTEYINCKTKLEFIDRSGNVFFKTLEKIRIHKFT